MTNSHREGDHLAPTSRLWPDVDRGPWLLTFRWQVIGGRAECIGLDVASTVPAGVEKDIPEAAKLPRVGTPLRTIVLRDLALAELVNEERVKAEHLGLAPPAPTRTGETALEGMRPATRRRLEMVAATYTEAWHRGERPNQAVAQRFRVTPGAAANLVLRARNAGLLPPADSVSKAMS